MQNTPTMLRFTARAVVPKLQRRLAPAAFACATATPLLRTVRCCSTAPAPPPIGNKGGEVDGGSDTHPDFQPRPISSGDAEADDNEVAEIKQDIRDTIKEEEVVIFIKGLPEAPVCGFSKKLVDLMDHLGVEYTSFDVLAHPTVRSYVKEVSDWPTIPQLFVKGEFVGGTDIITEMAASGKLQQLLENEGVDHRKVKL
jgi:monothiol glutaredoxin